MSQLLIKQNLDLKKHWDFIESDILRVIMNYIDQPNLFYVLIIASLHSECSVWGYPCLAEGPYSHVYQTCLIIKRQLADSNTDSVALQYFNQISVEELRSTYSMEDGGFATGWLTRMVKKYEQTHADDGLKLLKASMSEALKHEQETLVRSLWETIPDQSPQ